MVSTVHVHVNACTYVCIYVHIDVNTHAYISTLYIHAYVYNVYVLHIYMYVRMYVCKPSVDVEHWHHWRVWCVIWDFTRLQRTLPSVQSTGLRFAISLTLSQ